jgi:hypothetical protein
MPWQSLLRYAIGAIVGLFISDFLIKSGPNDTTGFIEAKPGFGLDDIVVALSIALAIWLVSKMF